MRALKILWLVYLVLACGCSNKPDPKRTSFVVFVIGDGVPPIQQNLERPFPLNRAQGRAMWDGASTALNSSPRLEGVRSLLTLKGHDDAGLSQEAKRFALTLQSKPEVLAVIGHATSETTRAAVGSYDDAGIPLLMPIATSDLVMYRVGGQGRVNTAFRLPPSDGRAQAPAVAYLTKRLNLRKVLLVQDISEGARGYSDPLMEAISPLLKTVTIESSRINRARKEDLAETANVTKANGSDSVVFVGYGSTAQEFVHSLRNIYSGVEIKDRPKLILTDGCLVPDLNLEGFESYLTFPHVELRPPSSHAERYDIELVRSLFGRDLTLSYEPFGYDAMLIVGQAVEECRERGQVSRTCVTRVLESSGPFSGTTGVFEFDAGENRYSSYDVFESSSRTEFKFKKTMQISADTLARFRSNP